MKHVLFIAGWCDPFGDFIKEHAYAIAKYNKVSYVFVDFIKSNKHLPYKITTEQKRLHNVDMYFVTVHAPVRRFGIFERLNKKAYQQIITKINAQNAIDICHINVRTNITELLLELPLLSQVPMVLTEHNTYYHYGVYKKYSGEDLTREMNRVKAWLNYPQIKYILPVSNELASVLEKDWQIPAARIKVIPNVAAPEFTYKAKNTSAKLQIALLAIWKAPKNPMLFAKALTDLPPSSRSQLTINWMGAGELLDEARMYLQHQAPEIEINYTGIVYDRQRVAAAMQAADVFVHPTDAENLPCVIIESLCCGTPVISHAVNGVPELVNATNGWLAPKGTTAAITKALQELIDNRHKLQSTEIAQTAGQRYSHEAIGAAYTHIYSQLN